MRKIMSNEKVVCKNCGEENESNQTYCVNCKNRLNYDSLEATQEERHTREYKPLNIKGEGFIDIIRAIAYIDLFGAIAGFIYYLGQADKVPLALESAYKTTGIMMLIAGGIIFCLLMALNTIGKTVIEIRREINK